MRLLFSILFCFSTILLSGQEKSYQTALSEQNEKVLASHFSDQIDLTVPGSKGIYSKQQAELVLQEFFKTIPGFVYKVKHEGGSKSKSQFEIGELSSKSKKYRTYILYKIYDNSVQIIELRIESED